MLVLRVDEKLENQLRMKVRKEWGDKDMDIVMQNIKTILEYPKLLSVFRLDSREVHEIDIAILTALLKGKTFFKAETVLMQISILLLVCFTYQNLL